MTVILRNTTSTFQNPIGLFGHKIAKSTLFSVWIRGFNNLRRNQIPANYNLFDEKRRFGVITFNNRPSSNNINWKTGKLNLADENYNQKKRELLARIFSAWLAASLFTLRHSAKLVIINFNGGDQKTVNKQTPITKKKPTTKASADKSRAGVHRTPGSSFWEAK